MCLLHAVRQICLHVPLSHRLWSHCFRTLVEPAAPVAEISASFFSPPTSMQRECLVPIHGLFFHILPACVLILLLVLFDVTLYILCSWRSVDLSPANHSLTLIHSRGFDFDDRSNYLKYSLSNVTALLFVRSSWFWLPSWVYNAHRSVTITPFI